MSAADLAAIRWCLEAYAGHWLDDDELDAVADWMEANQLHRASNERAVVVAGGVITWGQDRSPETVRSPHRDIATVSTPLRTAPPVVTPPGCSAAALHELQQTFARHAWSPGYGGVCVDCSATSVGADGRTWCRRDDTAPWPCPPVAAAARRAGLTLPGAAAGAGGPGGPGGVVGSPRVLGDCLDPAANARAFGAPAPA